jgi:hypothetical protein
VVDLGHRGRDSGRIEPGKVAARFWANRTWEGCSASSSKCQRRRERQPELSFIG